MVKKSFAEGIDVYFGESSQKKPNLKKKKAEVKKIKENPPIDIKEESPVVKRTTMFIEVDLLEKIKALAYWERTSIKGIVENAIKESLEKRGSQYINKAISNYKNQSK